MRSQSFRPAFAQRVDLIGGVVLDHDLADRDALAAWEVRALMRALARFERALAAFAH